MKKIFGSLLLWTLILASAAGGPPSGSGSSRPSSSSGSSYSGGGKSYSSGSSSRPTPAPRPAVTTTSGKSYSSGNSIPAVPPTSGNSRKPESGGFNKNLSKAGAAEDSKKHFEAANAPKSTYTTPGPNGVQKPVSATQAEVVRTNVTHETYITYDHRASVFYGPHYYQPMYYHDCFSPFLMGWLVSDALSSHERAYWMYNHHDDIDSARYSELLRRDANLQAELDALKAQNAPRNPAYIPPQMAGNPDVMYDKGFVESSYNPQEVKSSSGEAFEILGWLCVFSVIAGFLALVVYFLFLKEF